jgi:hypothetical protein
MIEFSSAAISCCMLSIILMKDWIEKYFESGVGVQYWESGDNALTSLTRRVREMGWAHPTIPILRPP